jgi:hypothetical protein
MTETLLVDRWGSPQASLLEATRLRMILDMRKRRGPLEIMYLPLVDSSWALRDTHFTADRGKIVATHQDGTYDKAPLDAEARAPDAPFPATRRFDMNSRDARTRAETVGSLLRSPDARRPARRGVPRPRRCPRA